jgi:hypothetical protein
MCVCVARKEGLTLREINEGKKNYQIVSTQEAKRRRDSLKWARGGGHRLRGGEDERMHTLVRLVKDRGSSREESVMMRESNRRLVSAEKVEGWSKLRAR